MNKITKILIGSNNKGKFKEIADLLPEKIKKISPQELKLGSPEETGKTFKENAELKANFFCKKSNMVTISDDSGLEINCLDGKPGIFSSRWADKYGGFDKAMSEILKMIDKINIDKKFKDTSAKFVCGLTIQWPSGKKISELGEIKGNITFKKGKNGFGYDPIFIPERYSKTFAEMDYNEKLSIDHRSIAYKKIEKKIKGYF
ncbi:MAG: non-canonical purine NTP pyrophosphatase, RdgB/HAM1 family [Candidatus Marinimicrobia bacterium]|nr:non-canonical purine NTP pyrophosphatase, RdgB/HAM1 family [Candidatus Neomarinimicrobiota bacterium]RPG05985.1 MAG: RdgB/HAM1 family non-canonical purine NTP pyrophosphatase [Pelagibacteraceae bacterium TMED247]|tara:strand:- start:4828 stop:5433 length:606 start_codon:yes stop_codon:yes gene_type:complete